MPEPVKALFYRNFENDHVADILEEIYLNGIYQPYLLGKKDLTIVDVGSNQGYTANYFSKYARQVYAIEPISYHQETIQKMIAFNKLTNITLCPYAISNEDGKSKIYLNENTTAHNMVMAMDEKQYEEIDVVTFDTFMQRNKLTHIDLLKLDPEGMEGKIIASEGFRKWAHAIDVIVGEHHYWDNMEIPQFTTTLTDLGFEVRWLPNMKAQVYTAVRI